MTGPELHYRRVSLGYSQEELAEILGISTRSLQRREIGEIPVSKLEADAVAKLKPNPYPRPRIR